MFFKGLALFCLGIGVFVLMQIISPIIAFKTWEVTSYDKDQILVDPKPGVLSGNLVSSVLGVSIENVNNFPTFIGKNNLENPPYHEFKLTLPKLELYDIKVLVNSNTFDETLAHLPGSVLPGEKGNIFITGHSSILARLEGKQKAFFAKLPDVKKGDKILLEALGQRFVYEVAGFRIVDPKDLSVINPPDSEGRYLTLMTCVPPGFNTKRLIVLAKLKT